METQWQSLKNVTTRRKDRDTSTGGQVSADSLTGTVSVTLIGGALAVFAPSAGAGTDPDELCHWSFDPDDSSLIAVLPPDWQTFMVARYRTPRGETHRFHFRLVNQGHQGRGTVYDVEDFSEALGNHAAGQNIPMGSVIEEVTLQDQRRLDPDVDPEGIMDGLTLQVDDNEKIG
ncbi:hypothetical protein CU254_23180 [Amycolatopsis sp. AA4]|uniref:hypothetical protein n=1 Tax=Actinomycetes TaxID=1760 RepID=UPI0001B54B2D|nr:MULTISPECIES: hypothetical protein [Actinomycetes]ATY13022.1 hypothetical protein CU254_23180 [Amycolatopsis sp. AA4]EFL08893.1 predicted protein [Streptomyces sp. AA4]